MKEIEQVELEAKKLEVLFEERKLLKRKVEYQLKEELRRKINRGELKLGLSGSRQRIRTLQRLRRFMRMRLLEKNSERDGGHEQGAGEGLERGREIEAVFQ